MREMDAILALWSASDKKGGQGVLATVVDVKGSAYRRPGARMLITSDGLRAGTISGGCLEADVTKKSWWWTEAGKSVVRTYDTRSNEDAVWEFGLGCNGVVRVLVERLGNSISNHTLDFLRLCRAERKAGVMSTVISSPSTEVASVGDRWFLRPNGISDGNVIDMMVRDWIEAEADAAVFSMQSRMLTIPHSLGPVEVFVEVIPPALELMIFGAGHDATPLVRMAKEVGWHVTVIDARPSYAQAHRFPEADRVVLTRPDKLLAGVSVSSDAFIVVMNHNFDVDCSVLRGLLHRPVRYIGMLGPRLRTDAILTELGMVEPPPNLHAPVGLDIGGDTPESIALSIVAEIQAVHSNRGAGMLRGSAGSIHENGERISQIALCA